jgi:hypothetical protein
MGNNMGNKVNVKNVDLKNVKPYYESSTVGFDELKRELMSKFEEKDRGSKKKIDTIAFYGDFREILIIDGVDKKKQINSLVNDFEKLYVLTDKEKKLIDQIILSF